jgi:NAD(P)-dependent dehydrogenase (short-subunit alcohol dehydrogenase family)
MELQQRTALITGSGQGIGRAIAKLLAGQGATVIINDVDEDMAGQCAGEIKAAGGRALVLTADVSQPSQVQAMTSQAEERVGAIDILVNNAGIGGTGCLVRHMEPDAWDRTLAINLSGAFNCCRAIVPQMVERRQGKIVNIASLAARRISKLGGADYTASKWGLVGFTKHLAFELADFGVNVNAVCPGATLTPLVMARTSPEFRDQVAKQVPLGRWLEPEDIAQAVLFLVSKRAAMITGQVLEVEGGQLLGLASDYQEDIKRRTQTSARNINPSLQTGRNQHD